MRVLRIGSVSNHAEEGDSLRVLGHYSTGVAQESAYNVITLCLWMRPTIGRYTEPVHPSFEGTVSSARGHSRTHIRMDLASHH